MKDTMFITTLNDLQRRLRHWEAKRKTMQLTGDTNTSGVDQIIDSLQKKIESFKTVKAP